VLAWTVAAIALVAALVAGGVALYALGKVHAGNNQTAGPSGHQSGSPETPGGTLPPSVSTDGTVQPTLSPRQLDPKAKFTEAYQQQQLTLGPSASSSTHIDLDEPRVAVTEGSDLYSYRYGTATFTLENGSTGSIAKDAGVSPNDCVNAIRTSPIETSVPINESLVLCIATSVSNALVQGITQKIVVFQVRSIGQDGSVTISVSAWNVPR